MCGRMWQILGYGGWLDICHNNTVKSFPHSAIFFKIMKIKQFLAFFGSKPLILKSKGFGVNKSLMYMFIFIKFCRFFVCKNIKLSYFFEKLFTVRQFVIGCWLLPFRIDEVRNGQKIKRLYQSLVTFHYFFSNK